MPRIARSLLLGLALVWLAPPAALAQSRYAFDTARGLLPKDVVPTEYRLSLDLDPGQATFRGVADIAIRVRRPVEAIVLNAHELEAQDIALSAGADRRPMRAAPGPAAQQWRLADGQPIAPGDYELHVAYTGRVHPYGDGLYAVVYGAGERKERMLATQLEPIAARTVFPGFDEPAFRAHFTISVTAPAGYEVVSNMPVRHREAAGAATRWDFATTPPMSSYLVTVTVGQFDVLEDTVDGIPLRILTARGKREQARHAMAATREILPFYRQYFGRPYPLPKLDQIAVPGTRNGAMEDWGAISYVESALLYDPARSSAETLQDVFSVIAHEVAHQWFGDLVTAASWDEIWLNEAFATWMARKTTGHFHPDWQVGLAKLLWRQRVMGSDAGPATRAIRSGPVVETAVFEVFDGVTYTKGSAVLDMLEALLGAEAFRKGLAAYFEGQQYSNATAGDLWHYLAEASGRDVSAVARSWTDQQGYPLLNATMTCEAGRRTLSLAQARFRLDGAADEGALWQVPFALAGPGVPTTPRILDVRQGAFDAGACGASMPYVDSADGFFRLQYEPAMAKALARDFARLPARERMALLTDALALGQAGLEPLARYVDLAARLRPARDPATLVLYRQAVAAYRQLDAALIGLPAQAALRRLARDRLRPALSLLGWQPAAKEGATSLALRAELIGALGQFGDEATLRRSRERFALERRQGRAIDPTIRPQVIANVARRADAATFDALVAGLRGAEGVEERDLFARALACVEDRALAQRVLELSLDASLPAQTASSLPGLLGQEARHGELAYAFTKAHFAALAAKKSEWSRVYLLPNAAAGFGDETHAASLVADQEALVGAAGARAARQAAAAIRLRGRLREREGQGTGFDSVARGGAHGPR